MKYIIVDGLWIRKFDSKTIITKIKKINGFWRDYNKN